MKTTSWFYYLAIFGILLYKNNCAQQNSGAESIVNILTQKGFQNLSVVEDSNKLIVSFENRVYRYDLEALKELINIIAPLIDSCDHVIFIPKQKNIPLISLFFAKQKSVNSKAGKNANLTFQKAVYQVDKFIKHTESLNKSYFNCDLVIGPLISAQFGYYKDPLQTRISLAPTLTTTFAEGLFFNAQIIIPVQNDMRNTDSRIVPGIVSLSKLINLADNTKFCVSIGNFSNNVYGIDVQTRSYFYDGLLTFGTRIGYIGKTLSQKNKIKYSELDNYVFSIFGELLVPIYNLHFKSSYSKFINKDFGWRIDIFRDFYETRIGFYLMNSSNIKNGGFNFSIPIYPAKYTQPSLVRILPAGYFDWEYRYRNFPKSGMSYETGYSMDKIMRVYNPEFLRNEFK